MTIKDFAKIAGVSTATVSRALNNATGISSETRNKIVTLAKELNYHPNVFAQGMVSQKTYTIGVLIPDITSSFYPEIFRGIEDIAATYNYTTTCINTDYNVEKERLALEMLRNGRLDGLIAAISNRVVDEAIMLVNYNHPLVMLGHVIDEVKCSKIGCNNFSSAYTATEHCIKAGHTNIAHVAGHKETQTGILRLRGYKSAMETYGLPIKDGWIITTDYGEQSAYEKTKILLSKHHEITAIFAANDMMAAGCYRAIYEMGLEIPEDISVIGHDDIDLAGLLNPPLTTMQQAKRKIGMLAAQNLFAAISKGCSTENVTIVPTVLIERESVKIMHKINN